MEQNTNSHREQIRRRLLRFANYHITKVSAYVNEIISSDLVSFSLFLGYVPTFLTRSDPTY